MYFVDEDKKKSPFLKKILEVDNVIIYGADYNAEVLFTVLENLNIDIKMFVLSNKKSENIGSLTNVLKMDSNIVITDSGNEERDGYLGKPLKDLSEIELEKIDPYILCYTLPTLDEYDKLSSVVKKHTYIVNPIVDIIELYDVFYSKYFTEKNININNKILEIGKCKILNPLLSRDYEYIIPCMRMIGDIILTDEVEDMSAVREGPYEYGSIQLKAGDVVIDCGANIGLFSNVAASKGCMVYSFEPIPSTIKRLKKNATLYPSQITIEPFALSDESGTAKFNFYRGYSSLSTMNVLSGDKWVSIQKNQDESLARKIDVDKITLDEFVENNNIEKIDFIKVDIEGAERYMLNGAKKTLAKFSPKLSICSYHLEDDISIIKKIILEANPKYKIISEYRKIYAYVDQEN